jgi:hypothetical protein
MTVWELLAACGRRWVIVLLGLAVTLGTLFVIDREPGVYWAQTDLIFLAPTSSRFPNSLNTSSESLINTASVVERAVSLGEDFQATSSVNVTIVDDGVRDGTMVRLPNLGGQWAPNFAQPVLDIQAVGSSARVVEERMLSMKSTIEGTLRQMQDEAAVGQENRISIQASPVNIDVKYVQGNRSRARSVALLLGTALTLAAVIVIDRYVRRRQSRTNLAAVSAGHS